MTSDDELRAEMQAGFEHGINQALDAGHTVEVWTLANDFDMKLRDAVAACNRLFWEVSSEMISQAP